jgi:hypothetical protein
MTPNDIENRERIANGLRSLFDQTIDARIDRYIEIQHQGIIPSHHFAEASAQCIYLYRDGYFLGTVMMTQSVAEGIFRFVKQKHAITQEGERPEIASILVSRNIITQDCADAFVRIWRSFRNDVHHMNPAISKVPINDLAKHNIVDLAKIESEIFSFEVINGGIRPLRPMYWDTHQNGTAPVYLRLD